MQRGTQTPSVHVVIPALNEAATLRGIVLAILDLGLRITVVDDGSTDASADTLADLPVQLLRNETCQGKTASLWRGFEQALGEDATSVVTLDADGQHAVGDLPLMLNAHLAQPANLILGTRSRRSRRHRPLRYFANCVADLLVSVIAGVRIEDTQTGFRVYPAVLLERIRQDRQSLGRGGFVFETEVLLHSAELDIAIVSVPVSTPDGPAHRASHFRPIGDSWAIAWSMLPFLFRWLRRPISRSCTVSAQSPSYPSDPTGS